MLVSRSNLGETKKFEEVIAKLEATHNGLNEKAQSNNCYSAMVRMIANSRACEELEAIKRSGKYDGSNEAFDAVYAETYFRDLNAGVLTYDLDSDIAGNLVAHYKSHVDNFLSKCELGIIKSPIYDKYKWLQQTQREFTRIGSTLFIRDIAGLPTIYLIETTFGKAFKINRGVVKPLLNTYKFAVQYDDICDDVSLVLTARDNDVEDIILYAHGECLISGVEEWGYKNKENRDYIMLCFADATVKQRMDKIHMYVYAHELVILMTYGLNVLMLCCGSKGPFVIDHIDSSCNGVSNLQIITRASNTSKGWYTSGRKDINKMPLYYDFLDFYSHTSWAFYDDLGKEWMQYV